MKILFTNPVGVIGGAERAMLTFIKSLLQQKQNPEIYLIVATNGQLIEEANNLGVKVTLIELPEKFNQLGDSRFKSSKNIIGMLGSLISLISTLPSLTTYLKQIKQVIKKIEPDIIHSNGIKTHLLLSLVNYRNSRNVWHVHDFYSHRPLVSKILSLASHRADLAIAISQAVAEDTKKVLPSLPAQVIYNAVDTQHFSPQITPEHFPPRVGLVATFARWKGHDMFLQAIAILTKKHPELEAEFYIVGGPIYATKGSQFSLKELQDQAQRLGIESKVHFLGFQDNVVETYRWLDIVVHASTQPEPFGLAIVEAMACGKPVIVAQAGGAAELFTNNEDAIGVPPGEPEVLALAIGHLLQDPEKRQQIGEKARETAMQKFNYARLGKQLMKAYKSIQKEINFL